jgi:phosphoglycolate phosphatase-like HAD superfamily hydrolase
MVMTRWVFDLDGTLVRTEGSDYKNSTPIPEAVAKVQEYKRRGDHIIIMTARGSGSKKDQRELTAKQLEEFGIPFDQLIVGLKPGGVDYFVDDKAINALDWLEDEEKAISRVETEDPIKDIQIFDPFINYAKDIFDKLGVDPEEFNKDRSDY